MVMRNRRTLDFLHDRLRGGGGSNISIYGVSIDSLSRLVLETELECVRAQVRRWLKGVF